MMIDMYRFWTDQRVLKVNTDLYAKYFRVHTILNTFSSYIYIIYNVALLYPRHKFGTYPYPSQYNYTRKSGIDPRKITKWTHHGIHKIQYFHTGKTCYQHNYSSMNHPQYQPVKFQWNYQYVKLWCTYSYTMISIYGREFMERDQNVSVMVIHAML